MSILAALAYIFIALSIPILIAPFAAVCLFAQGFRRAAYYVAGGFTASAVVMGLFVLAQSPLQRFLGNDEGKAYLLTRDGDLKSEAVVWLFMLFRLFLPAACIWWAGCRAWQLERIRPENRKPMIGRKLVAVVVFALCPACVLAVFGVDPFHRIAHNIAHSIFEY